MFFLHHGNVDMLWWMWQQKNLSKRINEYSGSSRADSDQEAKLTDLLEMHGLATDLEVQEMMSTENGDLCYRYEV